jgi:hypothetical protein
MAWQTMPESPFIHRLIHGDSGTMTPNPKRLTDEELDAYAYHARAQADEPLASLVAELQARRRTARQTDAWRPFAIVVLASSQVDLLPPLLVAGGGPCLVIAPEGTHLPDVVADGAQGWALETYDPSQPLELRQVLQTYGIGL